jgi:hypothetical protein
LSLNRPSKQERAHESLKYRNSNQDDSSFADALPDHPTDRRSGQSDSGNQQLPVIN